MKVKVLALRISMPILILLVIALVAVVIMAKAPAVMALNGNEGSGGTGGGQKCLDGTALCTSYGAEWRYYSTDSNDVYIEGKNKPYARSTHIVGCAEAGGYYRYAMIDQGTGAQVGVVSIGGAYKSVYFGGRMQYNPTGAGLSWGEVQSKYLEFQAEAPNIFRLGWSGDSSLAWFCAGAPEEKEPEGDTCEDWNKGYKSSTSNTEANGETKVIVKAKNSDSRFGGIGSGAWSHGSEIVYARPYDTINWKTCYYPGVQKTTNREVSDINGDFTNGGTDNKEEYTPLEAEKCMGYSPSVGYKKLKPAYEELIHTWENKYRLWGGLSNNDETFELEIGKSTVHSVEGDRGIGGSAGGDVGQTLEQLAETGEPIKVSVSSEDTPDPIKLYDYNQPCYTAEESDAYYEEHGDYPYDPKNCTKLRCTNEYANTIESADVDTDHSTDSVTVVVPYNFENYTDVGLKNDVVYAGEGGESGIVLDEVSVTVAPRTNALTMDTYATVVPNGEVKVFAYVVSSETGVNAETGDLCDEDGAISGMKQCVELDSAKQSFNGGGSLGGETDYLWGGKQYNAPDASAGDYVCVVSALYPTGSSGDNDMSGGNGFWGYSEPDCAVIAKRPTFQVWGADMYSNASIEASIAKKKNLYYKGWDLGGNGTTDFSSWVEEGLVLGGNTGSTSTLASGAATGYSGSEPYAGTSGKSFASDLSPLTIANYSGTSWSVGNSGITLGLDNAARRELIDYWINEDSKGGTTASGMTIEYNPSNTDVEINLSDNVKLGHIQIYDINGTAKIKSNIVYQGHEGASGYKTLRDIPKVIIYADNVDISCDVTKVDAIIITKSSIENEKPSQVGTVNTCSNAEEESDRGKQLKIFGMVITDKIILGRTYGQAAWDGNGSHKDAERAAAEVFDFDSSILLWSEFMASSAETDTLQMVYQNEIAPRY